MSCSRRSSNSGSWRSKITLTWSAILQRDKRMDPPSSFAAARFSSELAKETAKDHCRVYSVVVDPTGSHAAACTNDGFVHVWNLGKHLVSHVVWHSCGRFLVSYLHYVYQTPLGLTTAAQSPPKPDVSFQAHSGPVFSMCFAPSHGGLVT
jgi:WD40 repeat protein